MTQADSDFAISAFYPQLRLFFLQKLFFDPMYFISPTIFTLLKFPGTAALLARLIPNFVEYRHLLS